MTRIEPQPPAPAVPRRFHFPIPKFSLGRLMKLGLLILVFWVLVQVARTGVWTVPVVSQLAYTRPEPRSVALELSPERTKLGDRLQEALGGTVQVADGELTALARAGSATLHLGVQGLNVANAEGQPIELSFVIPQRHNALVRIELQPRVEGGRIAFDVSRTRVGMVDVPKWLIGEPTKLLLTTVLTPYFNAAPPLQEVRAVDGGLLMTLAPR